MGPVWIFLLVQFGFREGFAQVFKRHLFKGNHGLELLELWKQGQTHHKSGVSRKEQSTPREQGGARVGSRERSLSTAQPHLTLVVGDAGLGSLDVLSSALGLGKQRTWGVWV